VWLGAAPLPAWSLAKFRRFRALAIVFRSCVIYRWRAPTRLPSHWQPGTPALLGRGPGDPRVVAIGENWADLFKASNLTPAPPTACFAPKGLISPSSWICQVIIHCPRTLAGPMLEELGRAPEDGRCPACHALLGRLPPDEMKGLSGRSVMVDQLPRTVHLTVAAENPRLCPAGFHPIGYLIRNRLPLPLAFTSRGGQAHEPAFCWFQLPERMGRPREESFAQVGRAPSTGQCGTRCLSSSPSSAPKCVMM